jgi:hypothetical protein
MKDYPMSKLDEKIAKYQEVNRQKNLGLDESLIEKVTRALGPSIYNADAESVACSDPEELARVKTNFLIKKLQITDEQEAETLLREVCDAMKGINHKYRALFYALLVERADKHDLYA